MSAFFSSISAIFQSGSARPRPASNRNRRVRLDVENLEGRLTPSNVALPVPGPVAASVSQYQPMVNQGPVNFTGKCFDCISLELDIVSESATGSIKALWIAKAGYFNNPSDIVMNASGQVTWNAGSNNYSFALWMTGNPPTKTFLTGTIALGPSGKWNGGDLVLDGALGPLGVNPHLSPQYASVHGTECDAQGPTNPWLVTIALPGNPDPMSVVMPGVFELLHRPDPPLGTVSVFTAQSGLA